MSASQDGSESVDQFLARIASIKEGRDVASEERTRRMEEDFLKNRKERQARRLERARSLSPAKTGPSSLNSLSRSPAAARETALNPPIDFSPRTSTLTRSNAVSARTSPKLEAQRPERSPEPELSPTGPSAPSPSSTTTGLARSGTLTWQQRRPRDSVMNRPRPLSSVGHVRSTPKSEDEDTEERPERSRQEIAASLGMKDPTWFRQTQERGMTSAAFRKTKVEDTSVTEHTARSHILPGLSKAGPESANRTPSRDMASAAAVRESRLSPSPIDRVQREPSPNPPLLSDVPKLQPSPHQFQRTEPQADLPSSSLARTGSVLAARPASPTKGLGGFVESAMMKRSDSVNKRWSVQAGTGLKRGDSVAGIRPLSGIRSMHASSLTRGSDRDGSPSPIPTSRPHSRDGVTNSQPPPATPDLNATPDLKDVSDAIAVQSKPVDTNKTPQNIHQPIAIEPSPRPKTPPDDQLARSPSKTLDSRRWSPNKSSWLESALLSKPEPPKPQPRKEEVPAWKATLQRNKASRDLSPDKAKMASSFVQNEVFQGSKRPNQALVTDKKEESTRQNIVATPRKVEHDYKEAGKETLASTPVTPLEKVKTQTSAPDPAVSITPKLDQASSESSKKNISTIQVDDKIDKKPPPVLKPKPQTPPKTDFRATLRSRAPVQTKDSDNEPEFKAVFGKLKRAETQNYVAPDVLKGNILSGKAALNTTGGPQKAQRVDEFKESILQKKEAMKMGAVQKKPEAQPTKPEAVLPEALARRKTLHKSTPSVTQLQGTFGASANAKQEPPKPAATAKPKQLLAKFPATVADSIQSPPLATSSEANKELLDPEVNSDQRVSLPAPLRQSKPDVKKQEVTAGTMQSQSQPLQSTDSKVSMASTGTELPVGSKLASRLNPNLATLLTRGGSPQLPPSMSSSPERPSIAEHESSKQEEHDKEATTGGELTHMTKGRARGPKRRAPKAQSAQATSSVDTRTTANALNSRAKTEPQTKPTPVKSVVSGRDVFTPIPVTSATPILQGTPVISPLKIVDDPIKNTLNVESKPKPKPTVIAKSPEVRKVSSTLSVSQADGAVPKPAGAGRFEIAADKTNASQTESSPAPRKLPVIPKTASMAEPLTPSKSRINTPKLSQTSVSSPSKPQSPKPIVGLGVSIKPPQMKTNVPASQLTPPPERPRKPSTNIKVQPLPKAANGLTPILSTYFANFPDNLQKADFDATALLLRNKEASEKIKSLSHAIWELSKDGKKSALSSGQEHILFEESLYLVTHTFEVSAGNRSSEVYLWCGDAATEAAIEDAQLFCRKDAREHNTKLEVVRQGNEPARFFQALGGILITRRSKTASLYMLRGRRHLGHIAFDEVDLAPHHLCSGFSYLISAKFGKLYLWKGKGSGADEVGCARLIGMDLGLTGEIEEVIDGQEPAAFWGSFSQQHKDDNMSVDWQQRAEHDCYPTTLYRVELDRPKSAAGFWGLRSASPPKPSNKAAVELIYPFCDRDLEPSNVYILDAYRKIYVILNPQACSKTTEVVTALHLAQDFAMLSPSIQDRSLIPSCLVVFGEPPSDVRLCFRKWSTSAFGNSDKPSGCFSLEDVIDAMKL